QLQEDRPSGGVGPTAPAAPARLVRQSHRRGPAGGFLLVGLGVLAFRRAVAEVRGPRVADESDGLKAPGPLADPPLPLPPPDERATCLAIHVQAGEELPTPKACGDVDPTFVATPSRLDPAVPDGRNQLAHRVRLHDDRRRYKQKRLPTAIIIRHINMPD